LELARYAVGREEEVGACKGGRKRGFVLHAGEDFRARKIDIKRITVEATAVSLRLRKG